MASIVSQSLWVLICWPKSSKTLGTRLFHRSIEYSMTEIPRLILKQNTFSTLGPLALSWRVSLVLRPRFDIYQPRACSLTSLSFWSWRIQTLWIGWCRPYLKNGVRNETNARRKKRDNELWQGNRRYRWNLFCFVYTPAFITILTVADETYIVVKNLLLMC